MARKVKSSASPGEAGAVRVPLTVKGLPAAAPPTPVWTGIPLPKAAVTEVSSLRLLDAAGAAVPAQFDVQATWSDGSVKWALVSFVAAGGAERFTLVSDAALANPAPAAPVTVRIDTNSWTVATGPLHFLINKRGFGGLTQARLDLDNDGQFTSEDVAVPETALGGLVAVDADGVEYRSRWGVTSDIQLEQSGPMHAVVCLRGDLRTPRGDGRPLLDYAIRIHAFAGSSLLRVVLTVHNPRASGRSEDGARWTLGQSGAVLLEGLDFVLPVHFAEPYRRVTLSAEPGKLLDRIPLAAQRGGSPMIERGGSPEPPCCTGETPVLPTLSIYQDSSGGENWFHRAHMNRNGEIPLQFRGYRVDYHGRTLDTGLRAAPWIEVSDMRWAVGVALPAFWQNFPKSLSADADGTLRLGLFPSQSADVHEIQGGEQKTHEFWMYIRHRRGQRDKLMPLAGDVMPMCLNRPVVWADARTYLDAGVFLPFPPRRKGKFEKYEAIVAAAVKSKRNLLVDRELADEFGWRHFGDTPANNEWDQTQGPYQGTQAHSHYNNEYDLGLGMLMQALRNIGAEDDLAKAWWELGLNALWHEADIDIYHTQEDPAPIYNGGTFTHTAHGVDAGRSTHRGAPQDEMWGRLDWSWQKGSTPEAGHLRNQGIVHAWLLTGDRHLLDAAWEVSNLVAWKIENQRFSQIEVPDRAGGHNLQILLEAYLLTYDKRWLDLCNTLIESLSWEAVSKRRGGKMGEMGWGTALFIKSLSRFIDVMAERGVRHELAIATHLAYAREILKGFQAEGWHAGTWALLMAEVMMQASDLTGDAAEKRQFVAAAKAAFEIMDRHVLADGSARYFNSKATTMLLQGGGRYMLHAEKKK